MLSENLDEIYILNMIKSLIKDVKHDFDILYSILGDFHKYILIIQSDFFHFFH